LGTLVGRTREATFLHS